MPHPPEKKYASPINYDNDDPSSDDEASGNINKRQLLFLNIIGGDPGAPAPTPGARRVGPNARTSITATRWIQSYFQASCIDPERPPAAAPDSSSPSIDVSSAASATTSREGQNGSAYSLIWHARCFTRPSCFSVANAAVKAQPAMDNSTSKEMTADDERKPHYNEPTASTRACSRRRLASCIYRSLNSILTALI